MPCLNPILAVSLYKNADDKHVLKFLSNEQVDKIEDLKRVYGCNEVFLLPCNKCKPCRESYAKDWAIRCSLESYMHKYNYFVTLTYDDCHLPFNEKDARSEFSNKFLKDLGYLLTNKRNRPLFFACLEHGDLTGRIHFHCVLFLDHELHLTDCIKKGDFYHFHSPEISSCWTYGLHDITPFEHDCAAYVAKYATKQGFCFMSRNLSKSYYKKHRDQIVKDNFKLYVDFNKKNYVDIPKCFVRWFLEDDIDEINDFKLKQKDLQRLLCVSQISRKHIQGEAHLIASRILAFLKHDRNSLERGEL